MEPFKNIREILKRKEYAEFKINRYRVNDNNYIYNEPFLDEQISAEKNLILQSQQLLIRNWINPNTKFTRLLVKHGTGTGKTIGAVATAMEFISVYRKQFRFTDESQLNLPMVAIIGFSKMMFQKELLSHPEFGFISREEIIEHKKLRRLAETGALLDKNALADFEMKLKKRLSNKYLGGFFKFFGYKEFFNRLFIFSDDLENETANKMDKSSLTEEEIIEYIKNGRITLNYSLIEKFANSLIICDEIHNVYNSLEMNNYGIALRTILNLYDVPDYYNIGNTNYMIPSDIMTSTGIRLIDLLKNSILRAVFMSATPINNSPTEAVDLLNLLIPLSVMGKIATKDEYFEDPRTPKKEAFEKIAKLTRGYISFLQDKNPEQFPERIFQGEDIKLPPDVYKKTSDSVYDGKIIPFLKFIRCPMSSYHQKTYLAVYTGTLPPDGQTLIDLVLPNPGIREEEKNIGIFRTKDIKYNLTNAPKKWKDQYQIDMVKQTIGNNETYVITGDFMNIKHIGKYSTKYEYVINDLRENVRNHGGKVMIIHQYVKTSGVLFIQEMLRKNGFIDEYSNPINDTICSICGIEMGKHSSLRDASLRNTSLRDTNLNGETSNTVEKHNFIPARFIMLHGDIDKLTMEKSIEKYNNIDNLYGHNYMVLVGSKVIKESYDFTAVQHEWILTAPANIASLIQILGRPVRNVSHKDLPPEKRKVYVRIYVSSLNGEEAKKNLSYEELKYLEKGKDYIVIQQILKIFDENAFDSVIHRDIIYPKSDVKQIEHQSKLKGKEKIYEIGSLYFEPSDVYNGLEKSIVNLNELDINTFNAFYSDDEIGNIIYIIKRLFIEQSPIWKYNDLWNAVKNPPFTLQMNPSLFLEDSFIIALNIMIYKDSKSIDVLMNNSDTESNVIDNIESFTDRLFDRYDRYINVRGINHRISIINDLYILFPVSSKKNIETTLGIDISYIGGRPDIGIDNWNRFESCNNTNINITNQLKTSNISYSSMKLKFYNKYRETPLEELPTGVEIYGLDFHIRLVEDSIRYVFNIITNPNMPYSELHEFYFKMLYFYDKLDLLLFANHLRDTKIYDKYKMYLTKNPIKVPTSTETTKIGNKKIEFIKQDHKYNAFLMTSMIKSSGVWEFQIDRLNRLISKSRETLSDPKQAKKASIEELSITQELKKAKEGKHKLIKVFDNMLPVGHFLTGLDNPGTKGIGMVSIPKLYIPEEDNWEIANEFVQHYGKENIVENNIVIGYYEKNISGINIKFKLRPPIQQIVVHEDTRMIERGASCSTKKKEELIEIVEKLGIKLDNSSVKNICDAIKLELMSRELMERRKFKHLDSKEQSKSKRIKWFYFHFEKQLE